MIAANRIRLFNFKSHLTRVEVESRRRDPECCVTLSYLIARLSHSSTSFRNVFPAVMEKPDGLCMQLYLQLLLFFSPSFRQSKPNIFVTGEAPRPKSPQRPPPGPHHVISVALLNERSLPFPVPRGWDRDFDSLHMECGKETRVNAVSSTQ